MDFINIKMGCPIDIVVSKGAGSSLLTKPMRMKSIIEATSGTVEKPITVKVIIKYLCKPHAEADMLFCNFIVQLTFSIGKCQLSLLCLCFQLASFVTLGLL